MTDAAIPAFDDHAARYEAERRRLVPCFDALYGAAVAGLKLAGRPLGRILDLGAGTGLLAGAVADAHPDSELVLLDGAPAMLERARAALGERASCVPGDLADPLPAGPWDAVVSALAIHHLQDAAKRDLFARVHAALPPGGVFVDAEQVKGPTELLDTAYRAWHERRARELGASAAEWARALERMRFDRLAGVEDQLQWLRAAGFADADCLFKDHCFAVLVARRSADRTGTASRPGRRRAKPRRAKRRRSVASAAQRSVGPASGLLSLLLVGSRSMSGCWGAGSTPWRCSRMPASWSTASARS